MGVEELIFYIHYMVFLTLQWCTNGLEHLCCSIEIEVILIQRCVINWLIATLFYLLNDWHECFTPTSKPALHETRENLWGI